MKVEKKVENWAETLVGESVKKMAVMSGFLWDKKSVGNLAEKLVVVTVVQRVILMAAMTESLMVGPTAFWRVDWRVGC